jgi:hypothetical protein
MAAAKVWGKSKGERRQYKQWPGETPGRGSLGLVPHDDELRQLDGVQNSSSTFPPP